MLKLENPNARPRRVEFSLVLKAARHLALQTPGTKTGLHVKHPMHYAILLRIFEYLIDNRDTVPKKNVAVTPFSARNPIIPPLTEIPCAE